MVASAAAYVPDAVLITLLEDGRVLPGGVKEEIVWLSGCFLRSWERLASVAASAASGLVSTAMRCARVAAAGGSYLLLDRSLGLSFRIAHWRECGRVVQQVQRA